MFNFRSGLFWNSWILKSLRQQQFIEITKKKYIYVFIRYPLSSLFHSWLFLQHIWVLEGCLCLYLFHVANSQDEDCRAGYWDRTPILLVVQMKQDRSLKNESCPRETSQRAGKALRINVDHQAGSVILKMLSFLGMKI